MSAQLSLLIERDPSSAKSRHNDNSREAHQKVVHQKLDLYRQIYRLIEVLGPLTGKEIAKELDKPFNAVSGRCSEMKPPPLGCGLIYEQVTATGKPIRRDGGAVLAIARPWTGEAF